MPREVNKLELPVRTIVRIILTLVIIWLLVRLWSMLLLGFIAVLVAAALSPIVCGLERRGLSRGMSVGSVFLLLLGFVALIVWVVAPPLVDDAQALAENLPAYIEEAQTILDRNPDLYERIQAAAQEGAADPTAVFGGFLTVGQTVVSSVVNLLIVLVLAIYILADGERIYRWLVRYLPWEPREKLDRTIPEVTSVVSGYVLGQVINSTLFGIYSFTLLVLLDVPQALFLAILAAFMDAIPIVGILIATVPAVLIAFTVSPTTAGIVLVAYTIYQQFENYVIVPRVFTNTLQISSFAVLVAALIGGELLGIIGIPLSLPVAAAVPVIERIWIGEEHQWRLRARRPSPPETAVPPRPESPG